jgi:hypothetical protein
MADILDEVRAASPGVARRSNGEMMLPYRRLQCMKGCAMAAGMKRSSTRSRPPRFLVKNISIVSNIAHTVGAGSHSINPPCGWPRLPQGRTPGSPSPRARGPLVGAIRRTSVWRTEPSSGSITKRATDSSGLMTAATTSSSTSARSKAPRGMGSTRDKRSCSKLWLIDIPSKYTLNDARKALDVADLATLASGPRHAGNTRPPLVKESGADWG